LQSLIWISDAPPGAADAIDMFDGRAMIATVLQAIATRSKGVSGYDTSIAGDKIRGRSVDLYRQA
jgi:hypothetical protein